jgi:hypothetical protein
MNFNLSSSLEVSGFLLSPKDTAYQHFSTHAIDEKALHDEFTVQVVNGALLTLKNRYNLTKIQLRKCISQENINANNICVPMQIDCDPLKTK